MAFPARHYTMNETLDIAKRASQEIAQWLINRYSQGLGSIIRVENVEENEDYQHADIDLIAYKEDGTQISIEVKADRYHHTGNFFFETVSNLQRNTQGCFLYTQANYIFYYFVEIKRVYILKMPETRDWFLQNQDNFRHRETSTNVGNGNYYTTVGKLVPIAIVQQRIPNYIHCFEIHDK